MSFRVPHSGRGVTKAIIRGGGENIHIFLFYPVSGGIHLSFNAYDICTL